MLNQQVQTILDQISRNQVSAANQSINSIFQKDKKKQKLTVAEIHQLTFLKAHLLLMEKNYGEAWQIIEKTVEPYKAPDSKEKLDTSLQFILINILILLDQLPYIIPIMPKIKNDTPQSEIKDQYQLNVQLLNFDEASKLALKLYNHSKDLFQFFEYIMLMAESKPSGQLGIQLVQMMFQKLEGMINMNKLIFNKQLTNRQTVNFEGVTNLKLSQQLVSFQIKFYKRIGDVEKVLDLLTRYSIWFSQYQGNLEHFLWVYKRQPNEQNYQKLINENLSLFKSHTQTGDLFIQNFEAQKIFLTVLVSEKSSEFVEQFFIATKEIKLDEQFYFTPVSQKELDVLVNVYNTAFIVAQKQNDILIKRSLILTALLILNLLQEKSPSKIHQTYPESKQQIQILIKMFFQIHGGKFSFFSELYNSLNFFDAREISLIIENCVAEEIEQIQQSKEANTIRSINFEKIKLLNQKNQIKSQEQLLQKVSQLLQLYQKNDQIYYVDDQKVEKGDRLFYDDFLLMAVDLILVINLFLTLKEYIFKNSFNNETIKNLLLSLFLLEIGLKRSPWNFDFQMRQLKIHSILGNTDQIMEISSVVDIKAIQYDNVGFDFARSYLEFGASSEPLNQKINQALSFYGENHRDSKKNLLQCIKLNNYESFTEFYMFEKWVDKSYLKLIYYFILAASYPAKSSSKNVNVEWLYDQINKSLEINPLQELQQASYDSPKPYRELLGNKPTFNISLELFQTHFCRDLPIKFVPDDPIYQNYLGLYQDPLFLQTEIAFLQLEIQLTKSKEDKTVLDQVKSKLITAQKLNESLKIENQNSIIANFQVYSKRTDLISQNNRNELQNEDMKSKLDFAINCFKLNLAISNMILKVIQADQGDLTQNLININEDVNQLNLIFSTIITKLTDSAQENIVVPIHLLSQIYRFYNFSLPYFNFLQGSIEELKQTSQKLLKKIKDQTQKKNTQDLQKEISQKLLKILEELGKASTFVIDRLNSIKNSYQNSIINTLESNDHQEVITELLLLKQLDVKKHARILSETISIQLGFNLVAAIGNIQDRLKQIK